MTAKHFKSTASEKGAQTTASRLPMPRRELRTTADMILQHDKAEMLIAVVDATAEALDVARGIDVLLMNSAHVSEGLTGEACWALHKGMLDVIDLLVKVDAGLEVMREPEAKH